MGRDDRLIYRLKSQSKEKVENNQFLERKKEKKKLKKRGKKLIQLSPKPREKKQNFITLFREESAFKQNLKPKNPQKKTPRKQQTSKQFPRKKQIEEEETSEPARSLMNIDEIKYGLFVSIVEDQNQRFINLFERENVDIDSYLNKYNWTALQTAAYTGNLEIVNYLLSKGADLTITNKRGMSAMDMAMQSGHLHLVDLLNPTNYCSNFGNQISSQSSSFNDDNTLQISYDESSYSN
ncbi:hypothetical protein ABPG72_014262 [Tetrahymena utriculariae]